MILMVGVLVVSGGSGDDNDGGIGGDGWLMFFSFLILHPLEIEELMTI